MMTDGKMDMMKKQENGAIKNSAIPLKKSILKLFRKTKGQKEVLVIPTLDLSRMKMLGAIWIIVMTPKKNF